MTAPTPGTVFRALATRLPHLIAAYTVSLTIALLVRDFPADHAVPVVLWVAGVLFVVALSALLTVFALYRDDGLLVTGLFLTIITGASAAGTDCCPTCLRRQAGCPQLTRDPLGRRATAAECCVRCKPGW